MDSCRVNNFHALSEYNCDYNQFFCDLIDSKIQQKYNIREINC